MAPFLQQIIATTILRKLTKKGVISKQNLATPSTAMGAVVATPAFTGIPEGVVPAEYEWLVRLVMGLIGAWMFISEKRA